MPGSAHNNQVESDCFVAGRCRWIHTLGSWETNMANLIKITKIWYGPLWAYVNKGTWLQQKHLYISDIVLILTRYLSWLFVCKLDNPLPCSPCSAWGIVFGILLVMVYYGDFSLFAAM